MTDALAWIQDNIQWALSLGGLIAGVIVGLTGMGGAALVTPMLVLLFGINPATAVSSDVVASAIMKPVGAAVHIRAKTVHWGLVAWLSAGSIPGVLLGTVMAHEQLTPTQLVGIAVALVGIGSAIVSRAEPVPRGRVASSET